MRTKNIGGASVRERKAAALDTLVKTELTKKRSAEATKMSNLRALRLAKEAEQPDAAVTEPETAKSKSPARRTSRARTAS
jgi:hypothetical protein